MIKYWLMTGDIHGSLTRFQNIDMIKYPPMETGIIILGDVGFNYYLDERDHRMKRRAHELGYTFFCVRGNHESRPEDIGKMKFVYNPDVKGMVYCETKYPQINYLADGIKYNFGGLSTLILGGAYSIDKDYRRARGWSWWANEQLSPEEQCTILKEVKGQQYDLVLSHTCPISWEPRELFLTFVDQSKVDKSTETWLEEIKNNIDYGFWLFGHFHANKIINNKAAMLYEAIIDLSMIVEIDKNTEIPEGFYI